MASTIKKRSIIIEGRKTSVSLEDEFWDALKRIADLDKLKLNDLVVQIATDRTNKNFSSALRLYVLDYFYQRVPREM